jgi:hypothetical protein
MKIISKYIAIMITIIFLTGCLYPQDRLTQNQIPYEDQISSVQSAVDQYKEANNGLLPIKDRDMTTPIYQKYPIDFNKLAPRFIPEPPGSAFESGGVFLFVLIDVENNPTVKLLDLKISEAIRDLNLRINMYRQVHEYPPFKDNIGADLYTLDYDKLGMKEAPFVISPYSGNNLPLMINNKLEIFVDYRMDLYDALGKYEHSFKAGEDIRQILATNYMFVPAHSVPYTIDDNTNEPIFLLN